MSQKSGPGTCDNNKVLTCQRIWSKGRVGYNVYICSGCKKAHRNFVHFTNRHHIKGSNRVIIIVFCKLCNTKAYEQKRRDTPKIITDAVIYYHEVKYL